MGLPLPSFYSPERVGEVWRVPYELRAQEARQWARQFNLRPAAEDSLKVWLLLIDVQNTFCIPDFELFVGGRSGQGAVEDNRRLVEFIYRNLDRITQISATLDTHQAMQIFHALFLVDREGNHPAPYTQVTREDLVQGRWRFNPALASRFGMTPEYGQRLLEHYASQLAARGKYTLTIWPYHAMLGGIGHALVSAVEEALFFHSVARLSQPYFEIKGNRPFTENYSAIGPEVERGPEGEVLGERNPRFLQMLREMDMLIVAGQAKSHCVAWTVEDLLREIQQSDPSLASKVYLLEDCTSPVVIPGAIDYTDEAEAAFARFAEAGMHRVVSTEDEHWLRWRDRDEPV
uniref:Nicotinamidase/pyrazinamidase n=1 Tax=uncultured Chloroflexota bacterium TaxID=166587 RepID=H5SMW8_9CHLR|nr:nicotinamidase/pyrazinamidase [uncultured Chloroflexota bacterium]